MTAKQFDELTYWDATPLLRWFEGVDPGWRPPGQSWAIARSDPYWGRVLEKAQKAYGDPNIHFNTGNKSAQRYLVFGDGTRLPADGAIVYRDAASGRSWIQNLDGTATLAGQFGQPEGPPITPADYLPVDGKFVPVDEQGQQIGPQVDSVPERRAAPAGDAPALSVPPAMTKPTYPDWATAQDPDVGNRMTDVLVSLFKLFGDGSPAATATPAFPFNTETGKDSGIESYDKLKNKFKQLEREFNSTAKAFDSAIGESKVTTEQGRKAINDAIADFNSKVSALPEGRFDSLLQAEVDVIGQARAAVSKASNTVQKMPVVPSPGGSAKPAAVTPLSNSPLQDVLSPPAGPLSPATAAAGMSRPAAEGSLGDLLADAAPVASSLLNPISNLGGLPGAALGGGANPLAPIGDVVRSVAKLAAAPANKDDQNPDVTAVHPPTTPPQLGTKVTLPDGQVVDAPNDKAAAAATNALHGAEGGDAAQKAYAGVLDLDNKNLGAKIEPADVQAGDILKWKDKTMVAVGPGLVADPNTPGVVHKLDDVLKERTGFEGIFRPTADAQIQVPGQAAPDHAPPPAGTPQPHPEPHPQASEPPKTAPEAPPRPENAPPPATPPRQSHPPTTLLSGPLGDSASPAPPAMPIPQPAPPSPFGAPA